MPFETAFTMDTSSIKFGPGVTWEIGQDMSALGARRVMVVTDPRLASSEPVAIALEALRKEGVDAVTFDQVHVEPTDVSFGQAIPWGLSMPERSRWSGGRRKKRGGWRRRAPCRWPLAPSAAGSPRP